MRDTCPECGEKYAEPQPDDYVCGNCLFKFALQAISDLRKPIAIIKEGDKS